MASIEKPTARAACPKYEDLVAFNSGSLPVQSLEGVGNHISQCPACLEALSQVAEDEGSDVRAFRQSLRESTSNPFATDPEYLRMEARAHQLWGISQPWGLGETAAPRTLGQYQIVEKIGQGGMGAVYRALHTRLKKLVAIKILPPDRTLDARSIARFNREMEAVGRLDHPNIVRATDAGEASGVHYLVMDLIDGMDLSRLIRIRGSRPLGVADACELIRQAAQGLECARENGLVHRDVKPSNLFLSMKGEVKVLDLGLALLNRGGPASGELTVSGQMMGTADYTAPEQWQASHAVDIRADIYSLGCTLFTLLVGRPPFSGGKYDSAMKKMAAHANETLTPLHDVRPDVPPGLEALLQQMTAKQPADRPATPAELAKSLEPFCQGAKLAALVRETMALPNPDGLADFPTLGGYGTPATHSGGVSDAVKSTAVPSAVAGGKQHRLMAWAGAGVLGTALALTLALRPWDGFQQAPPANSPPVQGVMQGPVPLPDKSGWQNLLTKDPARRFWVPDINARTDFDSKKEMLWVTVTKASLLRLGETEANSFKLQVGFRQTEWVGSIGVYFGGRPQAAPSPVTFRCQLITMHNLTPAKAPTFGLLRQIGTLPEGPGISPHLSTHQVAKAMLLRLPDSTEQLLEIEVRRFGLVKVYWSGQPCDKLTDNLAQDAAREADLRGEFGIFAERSATIISTARFLPTD